MIKETKVPTLGEQVFEWSLETKPANTSEEIKELFAKALNIMANNYKEASKHAIKSLLFDHALGEVVNAQLAVNKVLTIKHYTENENSREEIIAE
jgi:ABC-type transporter MlaC component